MAKPFILNDQSVKNSHGFFLLNSGGRFERFDKNPVMLDNHNMDKLCGKWSNRRIDGTKLIADPDFDEGCALGAERKGQVERGYLNGASISLRILRAEMVDDEIYVTQWEMFEASVTPIPSNADCTQLKIYDTNGLAIEENNIKAHIEGIVKLCAASAEKPINIIMEKTTTTLSTQALTTLGLDATANDNALSSAIVALAAERDKFKNLHDTHVKERATALVELAVKEGKIPADKKEAFVTLALADFETTKSTLDAISPKQTLATKVAAVAGGNGIPTERKGWTCLQWLKNDPTEFHRLKSEEPNTYAQIIAVSK